jgi:hypothetical protein
LYAAGGLMLGALLAAYALPDASPWLRLPVCVCAGLSVYGLVLWLLDPDLLRQVRSLARSVLMPAGEEQLAGPVS